MSVTAAPATAALKSAEWPMSQTVMYPPYDQPHTARRFGSTSPRFLSAATPDMTSRPGPSPASLKMACWKAFPRLSLPR